MAKTDWRNRIVGTGVKPAIEYMANPNNWRVHYKAQRAALTGVLSEVGWVTGVLENVRSGHLIDGHARVEEALKLGDDTPVPFTQVDLSDEEEALVLATLDPLAAMAGNDAMQLNSLLDQVETSDQGVQDLLDSLTEAMPDVQEVGSVDGARGTTDKYIKCLVALEDVGLFERAIAATNEMNRGDALKVICEGYLAKR